MPHHEHELEPPPAASSSQPPAGGRGKPRPLCACGQRNAERLLGRCIDCFARDAVVFEAVTQVARDHGPLAALAVKPVLERCVDTGWKEEYWQMYQQNLATYQAKGELWKQEQEWKQRKTAEQAARVGMRHSRD